MFRKFLLTLVCLITLAGSARAQETTPEPEQNYIISWTSEIIFPQAIRFSIALSRPANELAALVLAVRPDGRSPTAVQLDLAEALVSEPYSEFEYVWNIPAASPPRLFSDIHVEWQATTRDGERARGEGEFVFTDQRVTWVQREDSPINLTIPGDGLEAPENVIGRLRRELQPVYDLLAENTGRVESFNLMLYVDVPPGCGWTDQDEPIATGPISGTIVPCDRELAERVYQNSGYQVVQSASSGYAEMRAALVDALVRRFYGWQNVPDWFEAGVAAFYAPAPRPGDLPRLMTAARGNRLYTLDAMSRKPDVVNEELWQAQSYGMVIYVASQAGVPALFRLAQQGSTAESFDSAYQSVMNQPVNRLLTPWEQWLFTSQAAAAFNLTPYQTATATPSRTPLPTFTPLPSVTPTPTGFVPTLTPLPTATPSRTPTPHAPTVTPRPPESLNTPTPTPALISQMLESPASILGLASIVLIVIAILIVVFTSFRRR